MIYFFLVFIVIIINNINFFSNRIFITISAVLQIRLNISTVYKKIKILVNFYGENINKNLFIITQFDGYYLKDDKQILVNKFFDKYFICGMFYL